MTISTLPPLVQSLPMTLLTFFLLQIDRLKPIPHAPGPKKPTLAQLESGRKV